MTTPEPRVRNEPAEVYSNGDVRIHRGLVEGVAKMMAAYAHSERLALTPPFEYVRKALLLGAAQTGSRHEDVRRIPDRSESVAWITTAEVRHLLAGAGIARSERQCGRYMRDGLFGTCRKARRRLWVDRNEVVAYAAVRAEED